ncbi:bifunctional DNA-formamidopyrimidine glycosylase/DNA-(apurinic or apyrimidinic site) lyase [Paraferrimonas sp. SM1919]|uniref:bifunctional DNA-formamidopyrimidine glycosylase/DNA-(apurinic or apyrimidinic site) lyase n=1 Tax=Paraferrimonas sp. SM1919 TaxID=2662263 RepID=UPI0013D2B6FD|nr:bifunctional DNA-formamidopyrimidine glycosylase/DNA-(apurinic or apyrimidinic site) lyase [Paraferrimonas sp. SM1919]
MPELPEVEVTRLGIEPHLSKQMVKQLRVHNPSLRWPIPDALQQIEGQIIAGVRRRAKYLLIDTAAGTAIVHLGMSGSLRLVTPDTRLDKHDHVELELASGQVLRYRDPRRFGAWLWTELPEQGHELLAKLGPEPLTEDFNTEQLYAALKGKTKAIKLAIMDNHIVVGVGNIYANEALFAAGIDPNRKAGSVSKARISKLVDEIKKVLAKAIAQGGTTLKDFTKADGKPGYFVQQLNVYGKGGEPCVQCSKPLTEIKLGQRATVFCKNCQS